MKKKILIVEDEIAYLKLLNDELSKAGYKVVQSTDGKEGLKVAEREKPDLILLDIRLPVMDGMAMLHELRKNDWGKNAEVIILTNLEPDKTLIQKSIEDKPIYYLVKSDTKLKDLLSKVDKLLAKAP